MARTSTYAIPPSQTSELSLGAFPFPCRSVSIVNGTPSNLIVTEDNGQTYTAAPYTVGTWPVGNTTFLRAVLDTDASATAGAFAQVIASDAEAVPSTSSLLGIASIGSTAPRMVTGVVTSAGAIVAGSGYTASRTGVGTYRITFTTAFASAPTCVVTPTQSLSSAIVAAVAIDTFDLNVQSQPGGVNVDGGFHFLAVATQ